LTLNILLSFAQFEREVIGERIRDKFAASRRKGMWMGGIPPLGYDVKDRHLVVNGAEAVLVRHIFGRFVDLASATAVIKSLNAEGFTTKSWTTQDGTARQGKSFDKGAFYKIVHNRVYLGEAVHKGTSYPGEHAAIIDQNLWAAAHAILADNNRHVHRVHSSQSQAPLRGLLRCAHCGGAMTPTHTRRNGRVYRYYLCSKASKNGHDTCPVRAVAAGEIEDLVVGQMRRLLKAPEVRARVLREADVPAATLAESLDRLDDVWTELFPAEQTRLIRLLVEQVDVSPEGAQLRLHAAGIKTVIAEIAVTPPKRKCA
ncbi:MAG: recombinase family protein, partial [Alphaproteobacteria bacterium]|nr:recombinase family protein [Alphaproteobacteria bacterium]